MKWRRGLLLAGVHLLIATASFVRDEVSFWHWIRGAGLPPEIPHVRLAAFQEEQFPDNVCDSGIYDSGPSPLAQVAATASLPLAVAFGWHSPCMPQIQRSWITNRMEGIFGGNTRRAEIAIDAFLCSGVLVQWMLVGGFPLIRPRRWWLEPSVLITLFTVLGTALTFLAHLHELFRFAMLIVALLWLWWFSLLLWIPIHKGWQSTVGGLRRLTH
ncbi:hypothetical protein P8935_08475 [Telmatobacter sp. DSM 110680]|uniref:Uncharacterized protein n=1 Tax=Telmatobacter sp. DSM 110680 TaxID=3036704 RepID=A0AAU7DPZ6_9BACT